MPKKNDITDTGKESKNAFECYRSDPAAKNGTRDLLQEIADENMYYMHQIAASDLPEQAKQALQTVRSFLFATITECLPVTAKSSVDHRRIISVETAYSILLDARQELEWNICGDKKKENNENN